MNLINLVCASNKRKKIMNQKGNELLVTRAATAVNPLTTYNVSTGNVMDQFANNALVKHGDYGFVGGDTLEVSFDLFTKIGGDVVSCPINYYVQSMVPSSLMSPTDAAWVNVTDQSVLDKGKTLDGVYHTSTSSTNTLIRAILLELDLTPLCNQKYGGSNSAMKVDLKLNGIIADIWAKGSGSSGGILTNGCKILLWGESGTNDFAWRDPNVVNSTDTISKLSYSTGTQSQLNTQYKVTPTNKIYILIVSQYPSDGTIPSSVSLDYAKITLQFNRTVDVVQPKTVYLPKYWAMVVKGISKTWDSTLNTSKTILNITQNNKFLYKLFFNASAKSFILNKYNLDGTYKINTVATLPDYSKYCVQNVIIGQSSSGIFIKTLLNNDKVISVSTNELSSYSGLATLFQLQDGVNNAQQMDAFAESFQLYDLQSLGKPNGLTDAEAEVILRGIQYPSTEEMVVNGDFAQGQIGWTSGMSGTWSFPDGVAILTATADHQSIQQTLLCVQNSKYKLKVGAMPLNAQVGLVWYNEGTYLGVENWVTISGEFEFVSPANASKVSIRCRNHVVTTGIFTFDNISLKYVKPSGALITAPNKELFDISKVTLYSPYATVNNGVITLNTANMYTTSSIIIPVLPNNKYELKSKIVNVTGNGTGDAASGRIIVLERYNNMNLKNLGVINHASLNSATITTGSNTNFIKLDLANGETTGTFTFSDISLKLKM